MANRYSMPNEYQHNPHAMMDHGVRQEPIRVVFVDNSGAIVPQEMLIHPSTSWNEFLSRLTQLTIPVACYIPGLVAPKGPGQGFTLGDGNWYYRVVKTFAYNLSYPLPTGDHHRPGVWRSSYRSAADVNFAQPSHENVHRTGVDTSDWNMLNCAIGYTGMLDRMTYGYHLDNAWIEVQHQMQKDRDDIQWAMMQEPRASGSFTFGAQPDLGPVQVERLLQEERWGTGQHAENYRTIPHEYIQQGQPFTIDEAGGHRRHHQPGQSEIELPIRQTQPAQGFAWPPADTNQLVTLSVDPVSGHASTQVGTASQVTNNAPDVPTTSDRGTPRVHMPTMASEPLTPRRPVDNQGRQIVFGRMSNNEAGSHVHAPQPVWAGPTAGYGHGFANANAAAADALPPPPPLPPGQTYDQGRPRRFSGYGSRRSRRARGRRAFRPSGRT